MSNKNVRALNDGILFIVTESFAGVLLFLFLLNKDVNYFMSDGGRGNKKRHESPLRRDSCL